MVDECEDIFKNSACLKSFSDDGFEAWVKSGASASAIVSAFVSMAAVAVALLV